MTHPTKADIEQALAKARTSDAGWKGDGWTKLGEYIGKLGACSIWVNNKYPTQFAIKSGLADGKSFAPSHYTAPGNYIREYPCVGLEHATTIFEWTCKAMDEEVGQA